MSLFIFWNKNILYDFQNTAQLRKNQDMQYTTITTLNNGFVWCSLRFPGPADTTGKIDDNKISDVECNDNLPFDFFL